MTVTTTKLIRAAGLSAVAAGLLYIVIQLVHPIEDLSAVTGSAWAIVGYMTLTFSILGLVGVSGVYLRQVEEVGLLGLVGYLLFGVFFLLVTAFTFAEALILPPLASEAPQFVNSFLGIFSGSPGQVDLGPLGAIGAVSFGLYLIGGSLFGIALFRARVLSRWAALLLTFGALSVLLVPTLPHAVGRYAAIPVGIALVWLGCSLWADQGGPATESVQHSRSSRLDLAAAE